MAKVLSIKKVKNVYNLDSKRKRIKYPTVYDIEIEDNHNYLANNILVSNSSAPTYRKLNVKRWSGIFHKYFFTATPFRSKSEENIVFESIAGQVVYTVNYKDAVVKGYVVPIEAYYYKLLPVKIKGNQKNYAAMYSELIVNREDRNQLIVDLIIALYEQKASVLVLVKHIEHGVLLQNLLKDKGYDIPFANGQDAGSRIMILEFNLREKPVLIGSSILGEGVDSKPCEWVLMAGGTGKSKISIMQNVGRALRKHDGKETGKVVTFYDGSHKWFVDHQKEFNKIMKQEYGVIPCLLGD